MIATNKQGEIADFQEVDQFQPARSQYACGYYACAIAKSMASVGHQPTLSVQQIINDAHTWYQQYDGPDTLTNTNGMTLSEEYALLRQIGLQYQPLTLTINAIKQSINDGCPVLIAVNESSVYDLLLGGISPYPWTPTGSHIILVTGVASDGNLLVRDSANCTNLFDPTSLRPGPRKYDAAKLQIISATAIIPPWISGGEEVLTIDQAKDFFVQISAEIWKCKQTGYAIENAILDYYRTCTNRDLNGLSQFGLPVAAVEKVPNTKQAMMQRMERGVIVWDQLKEVDRVPGIVGTCYPAHIDKGPGRDPAIAQLLSENSQALDLIAKLRQELKEASIPPTISNEKQ